MTSEAGFQKNEDGQEMFHGESLLEGLPNMKLLGEIFFACVRAHTLFSYRVTAYLLLAAPFPALDQHARIPNYDQ